MQDEKKIKKILRNLPKKPGIYKYFDKNGKIIYIGKATILKNRVRSYFSGTNDLKTEKLVSEISDIKYEITKTTIEAIILESNLIKKYQPKYNIRERDDKSFIQIIVTRDDFPRILAIRANEQKKADYEVKKIFGPYTNLGSVKEILSIIRKIFPYRDCSKNKFNKFEKNKNYCLYYPIKLCPAPCANLISKKDYNKNIKKIIDLFSGKRKKIILALNAEMKKYSKSQNYEMAAETRNQINKFTHINDIAAIKFERTMEQIKNIPARIETYDISNLGSIYAVGSMVVFSLGEIDKKEYRKFKIKNVKNQDDPSMMAEVISRRLNHSEWKMPDLIILDGGITQFNAIKKIFKKNKLNIALIAIAKGPTRKGFKLIKNKLAEKIVLEQKFILKMRDEAHRFAIGFHRQIREKLFRSR